MKLHQTKLPGVVFVESIPFIDQRGAFSRLYCERELAVVIDERRIVQVNHSHSISLGTVRGLHYQRPPYMEMKLVRCLKGRVWDVAVDLRKGSPTFLQWHAVELSPENAYMLVIPEGCAHGFQTLDTETELLYLHTEFYRPESESGVKADDPRLNIKWPLPICGLSDRDLRYPSLTADFSGLII